MDGVCTSLAYYWVASTSLRVMTLAHTYCLFKLSVLRLWTTSAAITNKSTAIGFSTDCHQVCYPSTYVLFRRNTTVVQSLAVQGKWPEFSFRAVHRHLAIIYSLNGTWFLEVLRAIDVGHTDLNFELRTLWIASYEKPSVVSIKMQHTTARIPTLLFKRLITRPPLHYLCTHLKTSVSLFR